MILKLYVIFFYSLAEPTDRYTINYQVGIDILAQPVFSTQVVALRSAPEIWRNPCVDSSATTKYVIT